MIVVLITITIFNCGQSPSFLNRPYMYICTPVSLYNNIVISDFLCSLGLPAVILAIVAAIKPEAFIMKTITTEEIYCNNKIVKTTYPSRYVTL